MVCLMLEPNVSFARFLIPFHTMSSGDPHTIMDIRSFVESQIVASNRSRNVLLILSTASVLAFVGFWNSKPLSWMNSRIDVLSRDLEYLKGRKSIIEKETALAKLKAKCSDEQKAGDASTSAPSSPAPSNRKTIKPVASVTTPKSNPDCSPELMTRLESEIKDERDFVINGDKYATARAYYHEDELNDNSLFKGPSTLALDDLLLKTEEGLKTTLRNRRDNILSVRIPFFGISFDINDLSLVSGITFTIILIWLRLSLWTELNSTQQVFERVDVKDLKEVKDYYEYLGTRQVFTIPLSFDEQLKKYGERQWRLMLILLIALPVALQGLLLANDLYTTQIGINISTQNTIIVLISGFFFLATTSVLMFSCLSIVSSINHHWREQAVRIKKLQEGTGDDTGSTPVDRG